MFIKNLLLKRKYKKYKIIARDVHHLEDEVYRKTAYEVDVEDDITPFQYGNPEIYLKEFKGKVVRYGPDLYEWMPMSGVGEDHIGYTRRELTYKHLHNFTYTSLITFTSIGDEIYSLKFKVRRLEDELRKLALPKIELDTFTEADYRWSPRNNYQKILFSKKDHGESITVHGVEYERLVPLAHKPHQCRYRSMPGTDFSKEAEEAEECSKEKKE